MVESGMDEDCYTEMLDYTIELFETHGLGSDYYGYHNIDHELEVTYVILLSANINNSSKKFSAEDLRYLFVAALFHDFDPQKSVDKPHEENVLNFISTDKKLGTFLEQAKLDIELIKTLILRTVYPWTGQIKENMEQHVNKCFRNSEITKNNEVNQEHFKNLGWYLSVIDRIGGYVIGDFSKSMEMAKMNAHALAWRPSVIIKRSVAYFEDLLNSDVEMTEFILKSLPNQLRKNFFDTVSSFMTIRQQEINIQAEFTYNNLKLVPTIEKPSTRKDPKFIKTLYSIFLELPKPLQFGKDNFEESVKDQNIILSTLRLDDYNGEVIGFAKGGPLENYKLRPEIRDENYGLNNTIFLEPLALKMGYWGLKGGSEMRHMFFMQAHAKKYKYLTSFALRDVIKARIIKERVEFIAQFDPERWDYYRLKI